MVDFSDSKRRILSFFGPYSFCYNSFCHICGCRGPIQFIVNSLVNCKQLIILDAFFFWPGLLSPTLKHNLFTNHGPHFNTLVVMLIATVV